MIHPIFIRSSIGLALSAVSFLIYEYIYNRRCRNKEIPIALGIAMVFVKLVFQISSFILGGLTAILLFPIKERMLGLGTIFAGGFIFLWVAGICMEYVLNAMRKAIGAPTCPVQWTGAMKRTKRRLRGFTNRFLHTGRHR
jgi:hypothetical protein